MCHWPIFQVAKVVQKSIITGLNAFRVSMIIEAGIIKLPIYLQLKTRPPIVTLGILPLINAQLITKTGNNFNK